MEHDLYELLKTIIENQAALDEKLSYVVQWIVAQQKVKAKPEDGAARLNAEGKVVE